MPNRASGRSNGNGLIFGDIDLPAFRETTARGLTVASSLSNAPGINDPADAEQPKGKEPDGSRDWLSVIEPVRSGEAK